jgi:hypothetical protein
MRSATVFSSNLRLAALRPASRSGMLRRRDTRTGRRHVRSQRESRKDSAARRRVRPQRVFAPRLRPARKAPAIGFAAMVLH